MTQGVSADQFGSDLACTRGQIVTFLWRAAGSPEPKGGVNTGFADVSPDDYCAKAVAWAVENGITSGVGDGLFATDQTCTRAQSVTFLHRAAGEENGQSSGSFADVPQDSYYAGAVQWAVENGVTSGRGRGPLRPRGPLHPQPDHHLPLSDLSGKVNKTKLERGPETRSRSKLLPICTIFQNTS